MDIRYESFVSSGTLVEEKKEQSSLAEDLVVDCKDSILNTVRSEEWYRVS